MNRVNENLTTAGVAAFPGKLTGDGKMAEKAMSGATGKSVQSNSHKEMDVGKHDTKLKDLGKEWPRKQKNEIKTSQAAEGNHPGALSSGRSKNESATPAEIAELMEDNGGNLQELFDQYANRTDTVCFNEFAEYASSYGIPIASESILEGLLARNNTFLFSEHRDNQGRFWVKTEALLENEEMEEEEETEGNEAFCQKCYKKHKGKCGQNESRPRKGKNLNESFDDEQFGNEEEMTRPEEFGDEMPLDDSNGDDLSRPEEFGGEFNDAENSEEFGEEDQHEHGGAQSCPECPSNLDENGYCQECGYQDQENFSNGDVDHGSFDTPETPEGSDLNNEWDLDNTHDNIEPHQMESLRVDDNAILESDMPSLKVHDDAPASHGGHEMEHLGGESVAPRKLNKNSGLHAPDTKMKEHGKEWPRKHSKQGKLETSQEFGDSKHGEASDGMQTKIADLNLRTKQKNTGGTFEVVDGHPGTLTGGASKMHENATRLGSIIKNHLRKCLKESGIATPGSKFKNTFVISASEFVTPHRQTSLAEAVADTEELLQIFGPELVTLEARYLDNNGKTVLKTTVPLPTLPLRGPIMSENKVLFRYQELAKDYANTLVESGQTCSAMQNSWGFAVSARMSYNDAKRAFHTIREGV